MSDNPNFARRSLGGILAVVVGMAICFGILIFRERAPVKKSYLERQRDEALYGPWIAPARPGCSFFFHPNHTFSYVQDFYVSDDVGEWHFEEDRLVIKHVLPDEDAPQTSINSSKLKFSQDDNEFEFQEDLFNIGVYKLKKPEYAIRPPEKFVPERERFNWNPPRDMNLPKFYPTDIGVLPPDPDPATYR